MDRDEFRGQLGAVYSTFLSDPLSDVTRSRQNFLILASALALLLSFRIVAVTEGEVLVTLTVLDQVGVLWATLVVCAFLIVMYHASVRTDLIAWKWRNAQAEVGIYSLLASAIDEKVAPNLEAMARVQKKFDEIRDVQTDEAREERRRLTREAMALSEDLPGAEGKVADEALRDLERSWGTRRSLEIYLPQVLGATAILVGVWAALTG